MYNKLNPMFCLEAKDYFSPYDMFQEEDDSVITVKSSGTDTVCDAEYHVIYNSSYSVPVLYFNMYKPGNYLLECYWSIASRLLLHTKLCFRWQTSFTRGIMAQYSPAASAPFTRQMDICNTTGLGTAIFVKYCYKYI